MKNAITKRIMEILYSGATALNTGGTAYANQTGLGYPGMFKGVTRERTVQMTGLSSPDGLSVPPYGEYINLFDCPYTRDSDQARPGIYIGHPGIQYTEEPLFTAISSNGAQAVLVEYKSLKVPMMIVTIHNNKYTAIDQRDQIVFNVKQILMTHLIDNLWYELRLPGRPGGGDLVEREWVSGTGQAGQGVHEAMTLLPIAVSFQWSRLSTNA